MNCKIISMNWTIVSFNIQKAWPRYSNHCFNLHILLVVRLCLYLSIKCHTISNLFFDMQNPNMMLVAYIPRVEVQYLGTVWNVLVNLEIVSFLALLSNTDTVTFKQPGDTWPQTFPGTQKKSDQVSSFRLYCHMYPLWGTTVARQYTWA